MNHVFSRTGFAGVLACALAIPCLGQKLEPIKLPAPRMDGGKPLMQALKERKSTRTFKSEKLAAQQLSDLLWAAFGINRADGRRTAPSAMNWQEVIIYLVTAEGAYTYDPKANSLKPVVAGDLRALAGTQDYVKDAPLDLVYVSDLSKTSRTSAADTEMFTAADTGFIAENVYLYCASAGLGAVVRASIDRPALAKALKLPPQQKIILAQTVGYAQE
jgi:SagB-type dehydrogenase family enzyme